MQIPDEVPKRRTENQGTSGNNSNQKRLRDDAKPIFQRDIGYATPSKDGTAKKSRKEKGGKDFTQEDGKKRSVKTIGGVADDGSFRRSGKAGKRKAEKNLEDVKQVLVDRTGQEVSVPDVISVKEFSDKI
jgi:hypothetical protein